MYVVFLRFYGTKKAAEPVELDSRLFACLDPNWAKSRTASRILAQNSPGDRIPIGIAHVAMNPL
jgi:hypothetical protein